MRILIVGGTAFTGPHVVLGLTQMGHEVVVFHRGRTESALSGHVQHIHGEQQQLQSFASQFRRFRPDVVLHMVLANAQDAWTFRRTFEGLARRAVAISSQDVYRAYNRCRRLEPGPPEPLPLTETAPLREKLYPYRGETLPGAEDPERRRRIDDYDKILVEQVVMGSRELPGTILRLPAVYGPHDSQHRWFEYLKRMDDGRPAILMDEGAAQWRWTRGYVENVAHAIALAVLDERAQGKTYNVGEPDALSEAEWIGLIGQVVGWPGQVVAVPGIELPAHLRRDYEWAQHWVADTRRLREELGYSELVPREEALQRTIAWERANPPAEVEPSRFDYVAEDATLARLGWHFS